MNEPKPFWMVMRIRENGEFRVEDAPKVRHADYADAEKEAMRLAERHPKSTFVILVAHEYVGLQAKVGAWEL